MVALPNVPAPAPLEGTTLITSAVAGCARSLVRPGAVASSATARPPPAHCRGSCAGPKPVGWLPVATRVDNVERDCTRVRWRECPGNRPGLTRRPGTPGAAHPQPLYYRLTGHAQTRPRPSLRHLVWFWHRPQGADRRVDRLLPLIREHVNGPQRRRY